MKDELFYQVALTYVPQIGPVQAKLLLDKFGDAKTIFSNAGLSLDNTEGIGIIRGRAIRNFKEFDKVQQEIDFIKKYAIRPLFITETDYPQRLLNCYDPPTMLYYKGNANLNASRVVSIIGTRLNTYYGKAFTEKLIAELTDSGVLVVSGLAFGIDALAHKTALKHGLPTVGVLAHSLDTLYPKEHTNLAKEMVTNGGLLTEFRSNTKPDKHNFPQRNRVVAGMSDATIVIETGIKGGSIITAELANSYNRDVFALPGRVTDAKSAGCNNLILNNKAIMLSDAKQFMKVMGWEEESVERKQDIQQALFLDLSDDERVIVDILKLQENTHIEVLSAKTTFPVSIMASVLLNLELNGILRSLPGKVYQLI